MANISALAQSARRKLALGDATTMGIAIRKAINGAGIFHAPDVNRLMKAVGTIIAREDSVDRRLRYVKQRRAG